MAGEDPVDRENREIWGCGLVGPTTAGVVVFGFQPRSGDQVWLARIG